MLKHYFAAMFCHLLSFLFLLAIPQGLFAAGWTVETLPMVHLQDARRYVCNPDNILTVAAVDSADAVLGRMERDKGVESVVVVVNHLEGDDPYAFGMALARKYGIGDGKQNTGLIIILAVGDRSYQILTGNGLEGTLPDAICRRVENRVMVPALKLSDWDAAILTTLRAIDGYVRGDATLRAKDAEDAADERWAGLVIALVVFGGMIALTIISKRMNRRVCPLCGKRKLTCIRRQTLRVNGKYKERQTWHCAACGYRETEDTDPPSSNGGMRTGSWVPPIILGGGLGRGYGGGGFTGGSFGGGSFGGGGSGGRF